MTCMAAVDAVRDEVLAVLEAHAGRWSEWAAGGEGFPGREVKAAAAGHPEQAALACTNVVPLDKV